jgi:hypothetical protein
LFDPTKAFTAQDTQGTQENPSGVPHVLAETAHMTQERFSVSSVSCVVKGFLLSHQRSFRVERPTRTSIIVMIQKRTTTWFSFQPFNS